MSNPFVRALTSPWAGFVAMIAVIVLGLALAYTSLTAARSEAALRAKIAALVAENRQTGAVLSAKLAACEVAGATGRGGRVTAAALSNEARAQQLAQNAPAGFDVCARMESADQAVLETLKK